MKQFFYFLTVVISFCLLSCATNKIPASPPKPIIIETISGSYQLHIQGEITVQQDYYADSNKVTKDYTHSTRDSYGIIPRGTKTIDKYITLSNEDNYHYTLQSGETLICTFKALTDEVTIKTVTGSRSKEYSFSKYDKIDLMICFNN